MTRPPLSLKQKILAKIELARRDFETFVDLMTVFPPARHQRKWIRELQAVIDTRQIVDHRQVFQFIGHAPQLLGRAGPVHD